MESVTPLPDSSACIADPGSNDMFLPSRGGLEHGAPVLNGVEALMPKKHDDGTQIFNTAQFDGVFSGREAL